MTTQNLGPDPGPGRPPSGPLATTRYLSTPSERGLSNPNGPLNPSERGALRWSKPKHNRLEIVPMPTSIETPRPRPFPPCSQPEWGRGSHRPSNPDRSRCAPVTTLPAAPDLCNPLDKEPTPLLPSSNPLSPWALQPHDPGDQLHGSLEGGPYPDPVRSDPLGTIKNTQALRRHGLDNGIGRQPVCWAGG